MRVFCTHVCICTWVRMHVGHVLIFLGSLIENFISRRAVPRRNGVSSCFFQLTEQHWFGRTWSTSLGPTEKWGVGGEGLSIPSQASSARLILPHPCLHSVSVSSSDLMPFPVSSSHRAWSVAPAPTPPFLESGPLAMPRGACSSPLLGELLEGHGP